VSGVGGIGGDTESEEALTDVEGHTRGRLMDVQQQVGEMRLTLQQPRGRRGRRLRHDGGMKARE
jgi:hypothetical protein